MHKLMSTMKSILFFAVHSVTRSARVTVLISMAPTCFMVHELVER